MRKAKKVFLSILWFVLISISRVVFSQQCINETGFFEANSTYNKNRKHILEYLDSNVTGHGGFYNSSIGEVPDQVYAMGMCINGTTRKVCSDCIKVASNQLIQNCPIQIEAFAWVPHITLCFVRYSNISFFEKLSIHPRYSEHNTVGIKSYFGPFEEKWKAQLKNMTLEAQKKSGSFSNENLYASMKCTQDLSPTDCYTCLELTVSDYNNNEDTFRGTQGGIIAYPSCFFRWDLYPFMGAFSLPPPPPPGCKKKMKIIVAMIATGGLICVLSNVAVLVLNCRIKKLLLQMS